MATNHYCDGIRRRDLLRAGLLGGFGLGLADYLRLTAAGDVPAPKATSAIFVSLPGGPSHMDSFDLKPDAPAEFRGEFNPIDTNCPGVRISEHLPKLARVADKFAILRGVSHTLAAHELGTRYMTTGNRPIPSIQFPGYGSVVAKEFGSAPDLPPYIAIPGTAEVPGYLGVQYAALQTGAVPRAGQPFSLRGISLGNGLSVSDVERRGNLLKDLDSTFRGYEKESELLSGLDRFSAQADEIITSSRTREAFDASREPQSVTEQFGPGNFGQSCLLAVRLIEAGVRFATVTMGGWDTHKENFVRLRDERLPQLDAGLSGLFAVLEQKGLLATTAVIVTGEFGRTPKINQYAGRDHWPRAMFVLLGGGGIRGGQVLGASDDKGMGPAAEGFAPDDVAASFYHNLGIAPTKEYHTSIGRPVMIVRQGRVIEPLFA